MPTNHAISSPCVALASRLMRIALEAFELSAQLQAEELTGWEAEIYLGSPANLLQLVLDELYYAVDRILHTPEHERPGWLEHSRMLASAIPSERQLTQQDEQTAGAVSASEASIKRRSER